jgi:hypothetical protein
MADIALAGIIPTTLGGIIGLLIEVVIISAVLMITDKFLAHEMSIKHSFIMAIIAYFVVPLAISFINLGIPYAGYIIPLIVWVVLGEILLKGSRTGRLKAAAVAFIVYTILTIAGVPVLLSGLL